MASASIVKHTEYGVAQERDLNALADGEFRELVRAEFEANYPTELRYSPHRLRWSNLRNWYQRMAAKGWIAPAWPLQFGGMGLSPAKLLIFLEEQERRGIARYQDHGVLMIGPLLMRYGTEAQRRRFLPSILRCEHIWCQGYSEPGAGSDLASLRTRAEQTDGPEGPHFVVNGQKTWTTLARDATHIFLLVRTDRGSRNRTASASCLQTLRPPASASGRSAISRGMRSSARYSSTMCACPLTIWSERSIAAGPSPSPCSHSNASR